jgi:hypothetical protein
VPGAHLLPGPSLAPQCIPHALGTDRRRRLAIDHVRLLPDDHPPDQFGILPVAVPRPREYVAAEVDLVRHASARSQPLGERVIRVLQMVDVLQDGLRNDKIHFPPSYDGRIVPRDGVLDRDRSGATVRGGGGGGSSERTARHIRGDALRHGEEEFHTTPK